MMNNLVGVCTDCSQGTVPTVQAERRIINTRHKKITISWLNRLATLV